MAGKRDKAGSTVRFEAVSSSRARRASQMAGWMKQAHPEWLNAGRWQEWKDRCALGLCSPAAQGALRGFISFHYARLVNRYAHRTNAPRAPRGLSEGEAWHLFETHLAIRGTRGGKCYKEWLFARTAPEPEEYVKAWAGGAALLMRDVVRDYLAHEFTPAFVVSLQAPLPGGQAEGLAVEDLLAGTLDPSAILAQREFERLAQEAAQTLFAAMGRREKVVLLARQIGVSLAHPVVEQTAGCRKSQAFAAFTRFARNAVENLGREYADEDRDGLRLLILMTFAGLDHLARNWAAGNKECAELLALEKSS